MFVLAISFYYSFGIEGILLGYALSFLVVVKETITLFKKEKINFKLFKPRLGFVLNNYYRELLAVFSSQTDKLIIAPIFGFSILGNYHLGIQVLMILTIMPSIIFQLTLPQDASGKSHTKIKTYAIIFSVILAILGVVVSPLVIPIILPAYVEAVQIIQILSIAIIPRTITAMIFSKILGKETSKPMIIGSCIFLVIQIPGMLILGEIFGVNGVAVALVFAEIGQAVFLILYEKKIINIA